MTAAGRSLISAAERRRQSVRPPERLCRLLNYSERVAGASGEKLLRTTERFWGGFFFFPLNPSLCCLLSLLLSKLCLDLALSPGWGDAREPAHPAFIPTAALPPASPPARGRHGITSRPSAAPWGCPPSVIPPGLLPSALLVGRRQGAARKAAGSQLARPAPGCSGPGLSRVRLPNHHPMSLLSQRRCSPSWGRG